MYFRDGIIYKTIHYLLHNNSFSESFSLFVGLLYRFRDKRQNAKRSKTYFKSFQEYDDVKDKADRKRKRKLETDDGLKVPLLNVQDKRK